MNGEYFYKMEDVPGVYEQPEQKQVVRLCFDERPCQLLDEVLAPLPLNQASHSGKIMNMSAKARPVCYWPTTWTRALVTCR